MKLALDLPSSAIELSEDLNFSHVYQPIFSLCDETIYGYESLIRGDYVQNPQMLFALAKKREKLFALDIASIFQSISFYLKWNPSKNKDAILTVNIFPSTILDPSFLWFIDDLMKKITIPPNRIIFELNEAQTVQNLIKLKETVQSLKEMGFLIALDDLGKGQSSLKVAFELEPDMVKLDQYFCIDLENSIKKQRFLEWITSYYRNEGTLVTLEGIETELQSIIAKQARVHFGQGYLLGRPQPLRRKLNG